MCSNHSDLNLSFKQKRCHKIYVKHKTIFIHSPSAGIGRQSDLKIRWFFAVNVQVVSWITVKHIKHMTYLMSLDMCIYVSFFVMLSYTVLR